MLGGDKNISQGAGSCYSLCTHPVSLVESCGQIVTILKIVRSFYECCEKMFVRADDRHI